MAAPSDTQRFRDRMRGLGFVAGMCGGMAFLFVVFVERGILELPVAAAYAVLTGLVAVAVCGLAGIIGTRVLRRRRGGKR